MTNGEHPAPPRHAVEEPATAELGGGAMLGRAVLILYVLLLGISLAID